MTTLSATTLQLIRCGSTAALHGLNATASKYDSPTFATAVHRELDIRADLDTPQRAALLTFAQRHDWGATAKLVANGVSVSTEVRLADGTYVTETTVCKTLQALRAWAGY